jgi:hypothetical protein
VDKLCTLGWGVPRWVLSVKVTLKLSTRNASIRGCPYKIYFTYLSIQGNYFRFELSKDIEYINNKESISFLMGVYSKVTKVPLESKS